MLPCPVRLRRDWGGGSERSQQHTFSPPSQLIGSCVFLSLPSSFSHSSSYPLLFSCFYFSFRESDHPSHCSAVTMATFYSAAGPHPLPLSPVFPIICNSYMVLNIDVGVLHPALFFSSFFLFVIFPLLFSGQKHAIFASFCTLLHS